MITFYIIVGLILALALFLIYDPLWNRRRRYKMIMKLRRGRDEILAEKNPGRCGHLLTRYSNVSISWLPIESNYDRGPFYSSVVLFSGHELETEKQPTSTACYHDLVKQVYRFEIDRLYE